MITKTKAAVKLCKVIEIDSAELQETVDRTVEEVRPYAEGIAQCEAQIKQNEAQIAEYKRQIDEIIERSGLEAEAVKAISPEKASFLGFCRTDT